MRIGGHGIAAGKGPAAELFGESPADRTANHSALEVSQADAVQSGTSVSAIACSGSAGQCTCARSSAVPERSNGRRTNRPERIAVRRAAREIANEPTATKGQVEAAVGDGCQLLRRRESHRSRGMQWCVIVRSPATFRSLAGTRSGSRHAVRLGGHVFRGNFFRSGFPRYEARAQALYIVAARRIG
jgi:hypothetical protein